MSGKPKAMLALNAKPPIQGINVSFLWQKKFSGYCIIILPGVRGAKMTSGTRVRNMGDLAEWPVYLRQLSN